MRARRVSLDAFLHLFQCTKSDHAKSVKKMEKKCGPAHSLCCDVRVREKPAAAGAENETVIITIIIIIVHLVQRSSHHVQYDDVPSTTNKKKSE